MKKSSRRSQAAQPFVWVSRQDQIQPVAAWRDGNLTCRFGHSPSAESRSYGEPSQDFGALAGDSDRVRFVLCDGVSLSYRGDYGAKLLGEGLFNWLRKPPDDNLAPVLQLLQSLSKQADRELDKLKLPEQIPPLVRDVLLEKRRLGTSAMFVCGHFTRPKPGQDGKLWLLWLGDLRIRFWHEGEEKQVLPAETFRTEERWSSRHPKLKEGLPHLFTRTLSAEENGGLLLYSDGLQSLDREALPLNESRMVKALMSDTNNDTYGELEDDASLLEFRWTGK